MSGPVDLLSRLVAISSVSRESNRPMIMLLEEILTSAGWTFDEHLYFDAAGVEKVNLVAFPAKLPPQDKHVELALVCHTDTVPYGQWSDATKLLTSGDELKGCGACDVKGFLACLLAMAQSIDAGALRKRVCMIFTADEEIGCVGARHLLERDVVRPRYAIVGEPTSLRPISAGKGYCLAEVHVTGREAHSAYPQNGASAIFRAARLIVKIEEIAETIRAQRAEIFDPPWTTLNVGTINGGLAKNIVAPSCSFQLEWRPIPGQDPGLVAELVRAAAADLAKGDAGFEYEVRISRMQNGFATSEECGLLQSLTSASGSAAGTVAFGTEAPWLARMGAEVVVWGPGSMHSAHSPREFVPRAELYRCVEILSGVIGEMCG